MIPQLETNEPENELMVDRYSCTNNENEYSSINHKTILDITGEYSAGFIIINMTDIQYK